VTFNTNTFGTAAFQALVGHEGLHVADAREYIDSGFKAEKNPTDYQFEFDGFFVQSLLGEAQYSNGYFQVYTPGNKTHESVSTRIWDAGWQEVDKERIESINRHLAIPKKEGGRYELTPQSKQKQFGPAPVRRGRR
jgi:hypothetical protein